MRKSLATTALIIAFLGAAPLPALAGDASFWGTGIGAALGGWAGSNIGRGSGQLAATAGGVVLGGLIGNSIGSSMDRPYYSGGGYYDRSYYSQSTYYEPTYVAPYAPPPPTVVYVQPNVVEYRTVGPAAVSGGYVGGYEPAAQADPDDSTRYCREYTQKIKVNGRIQESYGTACLQPDGTWKIER